MRREKSFFLWQISYHFMTQSFHFPPLFQGTQREGKNFFSFFLSPHPKKRRKAKWATLKSLLDWVGPGLDSYLECSAMKEPFLVQYFFSLHNLESPRFGRERERLKWGEMRKKEGKRQTTRRFIPISQNSPNFSQNDDSLSHFKAFFICGASLQTN